ncbi:polyprotein [Bruconha virus]|uniref:Envelopment polyprotein n=1 Tax=Bruconha virus TaxID=348014 RepID=A0A0H3VFS6_9VIRU|nr:polyprotein [Bruconha virus]AKB96238.1 polyprotein [Bruconha virus]QLA46981.1 polyprotein [Bruconha virus]
MAIIYIFALIAITAQAPMSNRCFEGGVLVDEKYMDHGIAELCVKDDISMIKTISTQRKNESSFTNIIMRKMVIPNYQECNPIEVPNGPIMIFKPDNDMMLIPKTYACRVDCSISLDRDEASIILHSDKLNNFEVMGTTTATRWFQGSTTYSLEHTCEHIQVTCGSKSLSFHACFKYHMACIRLLNKSYMPAFMIQSVCQNKEIILMTCLVLIIFGLLYIMTMSYICYILMPIFIPVAYTWGWLYNKSCKKCVNCGLAYHPFTKCGKNCVCGSMFENSERMKLHRTSGLCKGYKSLRAARILCKSRGSAFILAVLLATLLLSFIQPLEAVKLNYNSEIIEITELSRELDVVFDSLKMTQHIIISQICICFMLLIMLTAFLFFNKRIEDKLISRILYYCPECEMTHPKNGLRKYFSGEFTNMCNSCMCGCTYNQEELNDGYAIPMTHRLTVGCYAPGRYYTNRKMSNSMIYFSIVVLTILTSISIVAAANDDCVKSTTYKSQEPVSCSAWIRAVTCSESAGLQGILSHLKLPKQETDMLGESQGSLDSILKKSEESTVPLQSYILEALALKLHCTYLANAATDNGNINTMVKMQYIGKPLELCSANKAAKLCACLSGKSNCDYTNSDDVAAFYKQHQEIYKTDFSRMIQTLTKFFPGVFSKELLIAVKESNHTRIKAVIKLLDTKLTHAKALKAMFKIIDLALSDTAVAGVVAPVASAKTVKIFDTKWLSESIFNNIVTSTAIKICPNGKIYKCFYPVSLRFTFYYSCGEANKFYQTGEYPISKLHSNNANLCVADAYCERDFEIVSAESKDTLLTLRCEETTININDLPSAQPLNKCRVTSMQHCTVSGVANKSVAECSNGFFYEYTGDIHQSPKDDVGVYCFDKTCKTNKFPHHPSNLQGCTSHNAEMLSRKLKEINYVNLEQLKHSLQESIKTDLIEHNYVLTKNLPKLNPTFKAISIQGVETDSGIESSYIETNLMVKTGLSLGLHLTTKKGDPLFDVIIFVKTAHYEAVYDEIYQTGPTVGINVQHDEKCTGKCPEKLMKTGWLSFAREHTSQWGCEEFGCLAINEGCIFGHCKDIIKPEMTVLRKSQEEQPIIKICISLPQETFCQSITAFTAIITDKIETQFVSNEAGRIPKLLGYKSNRIYSGMINDLGTFSKMCGSVQSVSGNVLGAGSPRFDYICHAAQRKDITVSRCFDNFYDSCQRLDAVDNIVYDNNIKKVSLLNKNMGELRLKLKLGDINYKLYEKMPSFDFKASCVGCIKCIRGVDCEFDIHSTAESVCVLTSNCNFYHNNLKIDPSVQKYGMKGKCNDEKIWIDICGNKIEVQISIVQSHETIEVGNSDQTYFVKEKDYRCGTWLCKVSEQGISSIFAPFFAVFGDYAKIAFYCVLGIICLALLIYLLLPVCGKMKDVLKKNEIEYMKEFRGKKI